MPLHLDTPGVSGHNGAHQGAIATGLDVGPLPGLRPARMSPCWIRPPLDAPGNVSPQRPYRRAPVTAMVSQPMPPIVTEGTMLGCMNVFRGLSNRRRVSTTRVVLDPSAPLARPQARQAPRIETQRVSSPSSMWRQKTTPRPNTFCSGTLTIATHHPRLPQALLCCEPRGPRNREMPQHKACRNTHAEPLRRRQHTAMRQSVPRGLRGRVTMEVVSQASPGRSGWIFYVVTRTHVIFPSGKMRSYRLGA